MNREALIKLREIMLKMAPAELNMREWYCGSAACAAGTAMMHPWFNERGFIPTKSGNPKPWFQGAQSWTAVDLFFGLTRRQTDYIFYAESYWQAWSGGKGHPVDVARHITEVLDEPTRVRTSSCDLA